MTDLPLLAIMLAAGKGTRMKSELPKVLHPVAGMPMVAHVLRAASNAGANSKALVVAPGMNAVETAVSALDPGIQFHTQHEALGTAHAVLAARGAMEAHSGNIIVLCGDTPLLRAESLRGLTEKLADGADIAVLGFHARDPSGYGRLILDKTGELIAIREEKEASDDEKRITFCNSGVIAFRGAIALGLLTEINNENAKGEYYLTDAIEVARREGLTAVAAECPEEEVLGVNSRIQLAEAEATMQSRLRNAAMEEGVTLVAPETVFLSADTKLGRDVVVEPNVYFGPGVSVEDGATIRAFSYLEGAHVGKGSTIGPYARLRPGTQIGEGARVGNFVEMKNAVMENGAKANHLTYIGDAHVGANANIGAGTITCNYDGFDKHRTEIGEGAFIGSNTALVAPVKVGAGANIGAGSVISRDVPDDALAVTRGDLVQRENWASRMRKRRSAAKGNKAK